MKKIGILGGLAWASTVEYYAGICLLVEQRHANAGLAGKPIMPEMVIESLNVATALSLFGHDGDEASWLAFDAYHREALQRLERSGAEFAVIACNTAHHRFTQITRGVTIPVLNIVDIAAEACAWIGVTRLLVLGTVPVMASSEFRKTFSRQGIKAVCPRSDRDRRIVLRVIDALQRRRINGAAEHIREIATHAAINRAEGSTAVYLGCTELPLAFPAYQRVGMFQCDGVHYVNSTALHVRAAFEYSMSGGAAGVSESPIHLNARGNLPPTKLRGSEHNQLQRPPSKKEARNASDVATAHGMQIATVTELYQS